MSSNEVNMRNQDHPMRFRMFSSVFLGSTMMIMGGANFVWTSPLLKKLKNTEDNPLGEPLTENEGSLLTSMSILGSMAGCLLFGALSQKFSRKILLVVVCVPFLIHYLIMAYAKVLWLYFVARIICGLAVGGVITLLSPYICEIADPKIRGKLCVSIGISRNIGSLITYSTGPYVSFFWYHMILALMPITFSILFYLFALESPYHTFRSDPDQAKQILRELRGKHDVSEEINEIKRGTHSLPDKNFLDIFKSKSTMRSLMIGIGLSFFTQFTGYLVLMSFAVFILDDAGGTWSGDIETIMIATTQLITSFFASTITDLFQRKTQFTLSYALAGLFHFLLGGYFILQEHGVDLKNFGWVPVLSMAGYFVIYDLGMGILTQTLLGELFSPVVKSSAIALCQIVAAVVGFVNTLMFRRVQETIGHGECFWIYAAFSVAGAIFVKLCLVETKGKTLGQVQDDIDRNNEMPKKKSYVLSEY